MKTAALVMFTAEDGGSGLRVSEVCCLRSHRIEIMPAPFHPFKSHSQNSQLGLAPRAKRPWPGVAPYAKPGSLGACPASVTDIYSWH